MDASTGLAILGTAIGSKEIIGKILGPTADYIGSGVEVWTKRRVDNVTRIFRSAQTKLGAKLEREGTVPPRVLKEVLQEGSFCDDELAAEYFGGVLASSRSEIPRDDRGASLARLVSRLTTYQLRTHYLLYSVIKTAFNGQNIIVNKPEGPGELATYLPRSSYSDGMELSPKEDLLVIIGHSMFGLYREDLLNRFISTTKEDLAENYETEVEESGIIFQPSALGVELFLWAHGRGEVPVWRFLESEIDLDPQLCWKPDFKTLPERFRTSSPLSRKKIKISDAS
jgi:hypothetical protein